MKTIISLPLPANRFGRFARFTAFRSSRTLLLLISAALLISFLISGCGEIRYDHRTKMYTLDKDGQALSSTTPQPGVKRYRIDQYDRATAYYTLRQGNRPGARAAGARPAALGQTATADAAAAPQQGDLQLVIDASDVLFEFDKWVIKREFHPVLDKWVEFFQNHPEVHAEIHGHADSTGPSTYNQKLSERRALAVVNYLVDKGVNPGRLTATGFGEEQPVAPNTTREGRQQNRRVELHY